MIINFEFIDRQKFYDSLKINKDIKVKKINYGDLSYLWIENFLKTPEKAIELLSKYPAIDGGVYTPGARQNLTPMDLVPVLQAYKTIMATVKVWKNSWVPHTDFDLVCNLWLCNYEGGTAIYKYRGFLNQKDITPKPQGHDENNLVPWQNFEGDDDWELYYIIPSEFNTVAIYDGTNFHSTYANFNEEYRYSLISFYHSNRKF